MKIFKNGIFKIVLIALLIIGGSKLAVSIPKIFGNALVKTIDWITGGTEPKYDSDGKMIYEDGRHTLTSFGKRKEFEIWKNGTKEDERWILFDRDKNKAIDDINRYIMPPSKSEVYTIGKKGYTKIDTNTSKIKQSKNIYDFSQGEREIFRSLENGNGFIKK